MFKSLGSLVSPKAGLGIMKSAIEKTLNTRIENFDVIYKHEEKVIDFRLYDYWDYSKEPAVFHEKIVMKYGDGEKLCGIVHNMLLEHVKTNDKIVAAITNYKDKSCKLLIIRDGEKKTLNINI